MSKAFTREDDAAPEAVVARHRELALPPGTKNYLTRGGAQRLREEHDALLRGGRAEDAARVAELAEHLAHAEVVDPAAQDRERVLFGATVTLEGDDREVTYKIVGIPEADPKSGAISWQSPIARALLGNRLGDTIVIRDEELEIVRISYDD